MDMVEYKKAMRNGDMIFLAGGLLFVGNLLAILISPLLIGTLPFGIMIMGYGAHIQYAANEALKNEILAAISSSRIGASAEVAAVMGGEIPKEGCPQCGFKDSEQQTI